MSVNLNNESHPNPIEPKEKQHCTVAFAALGLKKNVAGWKETRDAKESENEGTSECGWKDCVYPAALMNLVMGSVVYVSSALVLQDSLYVLKAYSILVCIINWILMDCSSFTNFCTRLGDIKSNMLQDNQPYKYNFNNSTIPTITNYRGELDRYWGCAGMNIISHSVTPPRS